MLICRHYYGKRYGSSYHERIYQLMQAREKTVIFKLQCYPPNIVFSLQQLEGFNPPYIQEHRNCVCSINETARAIFAEKAIQLSTFCLSIPARQSSLQLDHAMARPDTSNYAADFLDHSKNFLRLGFDVFLKKVNRLTGKKPKTTFCFSNSALFYSRTTAVAKWFIQQNIILTPFYGALAVLLKSDQKLYSIEVRILLQIEIFCI